MIKSGKTLAVVILTSFLLASCSMPWSNNDTGGEVTIYPINSSGTMTPITTKVYTEDELNNLKPADLVLKPEESQDPAKRLEYKNKIDQYRNNILKKVSFKDESGFKGPEDIKNFLKEKGFKFDNTEFTFSSDLGGYTYLSQSGALKLDMTYGSRQWEVLNEYITKGTLEKRPELQKVLIMNYGIELTLNNSGTVVSVLEKKIDKDIGDKMSTLQKNIMKINMEISGRPFNDSSISGTGETVVKPNVPLTPEQTKAKYEEIRALELEAKGLREKLFVIGAEKTDSPIIGKKIWEFSIK